MDTIPSQGEIIKKAKSKLKFDTYYGIIKDKFFAHGRRHVPTIIVKTPSGDQRVLLQYDNSGLFEYLNVNDSISKNYNDNTVFVYRDSIVKEFELFVLDKVCKPLPRFPRDSNRVF